jgi:hypothetical protein
MPPPANFDPIARPYRWLEYLTLGPLLHLTRTHFLPQLQYPNARRRALILGDGDGRFLDRLLHQNPNLHALAVDTSASMLLLLRQRCEHASTRFQTLQTSALTITPDPATDLIVTHFFLDCLTQPELDTLALRLAAHIRPATLWLLSDFAIPHHPLLKPLARLYIRSLYLAFRLLTGLRVTHLPDPHAALTAAGFERIDHHHRLGGLFYTEIWRRK